MIEGAESMIRASPLVRAETKGQLHEVHRHD